MCALVTGVQTCALPISYGKQRGNENTHYSEHQVFAKWFPENSDPCQAQPFCNNANAAIRRSLWQKSPYDEALTGLEALAWARQALTAGRRIDCVAAAEVVTGQAGHEPETRR